MSVVILVALGPCLLLHGLTLTADEHRQMPTRREEGYELLSLMRHLRLPLVRLLYSVWGLIFTLALTLALWTPPSAFR